MLFESKKKATERVASKMRASIRFIFLQTVD